MTKTVGIVGARGYTGTELLKILHRHPEVEVAWAGSREKAGQPVDDYPGLVFTDTTPEFVAGNPVDVMFLALPDGASAVYVDMIPEETVVIDISADHRWDSDWVYGLPELFRDRIAGSRRIANPGCYATVMQLALAPLLDDTDGTPVVFGVSGYSGAGTTPGPRNDPERLADNLMPYKLSGHNHEREAIAHLGRPVRFMPHVHPAFRGLLVTANVPVSSPMTGDDVRERMEKAYADEPLVEITDDMPELAEGANLLGVLLGGFTVTEDGRSVVVVGAEDNLLKGAAVQAVQNMNLALGIDEFTGIL
ncbi:MAG TPA: N-acetyl-gamma-glutamyl-phosphate reductase [Acidimicrobiia bacterium]